MAGANSDFPRRLPPSVVTLNRLSGPNTTSLPGPGTRPRRYWAIRLRRTPSGANTTCETLAAASGIGKSSNLFGGGTGMRGSCSQLLNSNGSSSSEIEKALGCSSSLAGERSSAAATSSVVVSASDPDSPVGSCSSAERSRDPPRQRHVPRKSRIHSVLPCIAHHPWPTGPSSAIRVRENPFIGHNRHNRQKSTLFSARNTL